MRHAPLCAPLLLLLACVGAEPSAGHGSVSANGLSLNKLSLNKLSLNKLSLNGLSGDGLGGLEQSADGREVLEYLVRCALPEDVTVHASHAGVDYEFPGRLGLAPEWMRGACDRTCQRWVSACLLAHVNAHGVSVPISLRGPHPALTATADEERDYPVQEGAFYGNLFDPDFGVDYPMNICSGDGGAHLQDSASDLWLRLCGILTPDLCPIADAGPCILAFGDDPPACEHQLADGTYQTCWRAQGVNMFTGEPDLTDLPTEADAVFDEVITVYLQD